MNLDLDSILELSPPLVLVLWLNLVGWLAKQSPFPDKYIPHVLVVFGGICWPLLYNYSDAIINVRYQLPMAILQGMCLGGTAVGFHQATRAFGKDKPPTISPPPTPPKT